MKVILRVEPNRDGAAEAKSLLFLEQGQEDVELFFNGTIIWPIDLARICHGNDVNTEFDIVVQA